jgi:hypothetical protein
VFYVGFGLGHSGNEMSRLKKIGIGVWKLSWNEWKTNGVIAKNMAIVLIEILHSYTERGGASVPQREINRYSQCDALSLMQKWDP